MDDKSDYFGPLEKLLLAYVDKRTVAEVRDAYELAEKAHRGQKRRSGEDYITHPVAAACILAEMKLEPEAIMATLLHDVIEDTEVSKKDLALRFGDSVAELVDGVSKLTQIKFSSRAEAQAENFRKMVLAMVRDIRVIIVKLADRLHNMRTLGVLPDEKRRRIAKETLEIYAPIAHRLGIHPFFTELEDLGFKALYPLRYRVLKQAIEQTMQHREKTVQKIIQQFTETMQSRGLDDFIVYNRHRHLYRIYRKIKAKTASFSEIMDIYGFRVIVNSQDDCYRALGAVHYVYKPRPDRFRDYVAIPKANGYQALHTTLFGPQGMPIEVQIRTKDMETIAEHGVASRWTQRKHPDHDPTQSRARRWVKNLLEMQQSASNSVEFIETVKNDLFPTEVYVFTPEGDILELPQGATPVDFAFAIHSDIGNTCVAAKIDRVLSPLSQTLMNGQTVEIITASGASPNPAWLNFVTTGRAKTNIKHYLKNQQQNESAKLGRRLLETVLKDLGHSIDSIPPEQLSESVKSLGATSFDALCAEIGFGNRVPHVVADTLFPDLAKRRSNDSRFEDASQVTPLVLKGTEGMVVKFAECCHPIPGDPIVGCLQKGRGILVHVEDCVEAKRILNKPGKGISLTWEDTVQGEFSVGIQVEVMNQRGVLAMIAGAIADAEANIDNVGVDNQDGQHNMVALLISVKSLEHLRQVMRKLSQIPVVIKVKRV